MPHSRKDWPTRVGEAIGLGICVVAMLVGLYALALAAVWAWHHVVGTDSHQDSQSLTAGQRDPRQPVRPVKLGTALTMTSLGVVRVTTYCATGTTTASGTWPRTGDAATLDRGVPFGTVLWIDGNGTRTVTDRIGHGSDVDLYDGRPGCETRADRYGVQHQHVAVLRIR